MKDNETFVSGFKLGRNFGEIEISKFVRKYCEQPD